MTIPHKIYVSSISSGDNKANVKFARRGNITAIKFVVCGVCGADNTGTQRWELSKQSASSFALNDTPSSVLAYFTSGPGASGAGYCTNELIAGLSIPVEPNDTIYLHELIGGTAPASGLVMCMLFCTS